MKTHHLLFILIALPLFCSCRSSRSMLREIQALKSSLYYELTSPIYQEKADQTVYLDFIDYSNMDYYTSVKRKKSAYIPLLLYNYEGELFHLRLGESSLTQLYREFLTEALLTECNSSTCCHLIDNQTTFHAFVSFPPFHLYNRYHNPQAHNVLPATAATVMIIASSPRVCKPLIIDSLPPTSIPRRKRRIHIRRVIILCIHDSLLLRNK